MYQTQVTIHMRDTDATGVLYFTEQLRICQEVLESFLESCGYSLQRLLEKADFVIPIVHAESDYFSPIFPGDKLSVQMITTRIGTSSFTLSYTCKRIETGEEVGTAEIVHVTVDKKFREKMPIPAFFAEHLRKIQ